MILSMFLFWTNSSSSAKPLDDSVCLQKAGNKPATEKACDGGKDCAQWHTGSWKPVRKTFHSKKKILMLMTQFFFMIFTVQ